jgi:hypothetical protein
MDYLDRYEVIKMARIYSNIIKVSVSLPSGGGGSGYPACPEWYIQNPDGTYMGLEHGSTTNPLTPLNYVKVYYNGTYYGTAMLQKDTITGAWYIPIKTAGGVYWYHVIPGQCTPSGSSGGGGGLAINNFSVTYSCKYGIVVSGTVTYNNNPVPNVEVDIGFCSAFDWTKIQFTGNYDAVGTDSNGSFRDYVFTTTPPGGSNCIVAMVKYNNLIAVVSQNITIPKC